jgi:uncharacterized protein HemX
MAASHTSVAPPTVSPAPEPDPQLKVSPRALAALVLALVAGLSGMGWFGKTGDHVTVREFDQFREQQRVRDERTEAKLEELLGALHQAQLQERPAPPARRRKRK